MCSLLVLKACNRSPFLSQYTKFILHYLLDVRDIVVYYSSLFEYCFVIVYTEMVSLDKNLMQMLRRQLKHMGYLRVTLVVVCLVVY